MLNDWKKKCSCEVKDLEGGNKEIKQYKTTQRPQNPLLFLCESSRDKGKEDGSYILLKCRWQWQAGLVSSTILIPEDPNPSRMLLSNPQLTCEHMFWGCTSTAVAMLQHQIPLFCDSALTLVRVWIERSISSCVFPFIVNHYRSIKPYIA